MHPWVWFWLAVLLCGLLPGTAAEANQSCFPTAGDGGTPHQIRIVLDAGYMADAMRPAVLAETARVLTERLQGCGVSAPAVRITSVDVMVVEIPATWRSDDAATLLGRQAVVDFREEQGSVGNPEWLPVTGQGRDGTVVALTGERFAHVELTYARGTNEPLIVFELDEEGTALLAEVTTRLASAPGIRRRLGVFVDGEAVMTPVVQSPIAEGKGQISGPFTAAEARLLTVQLNSGPLPMPVRIEPDAPAAFPQDRGRE
jgi:preprotein translocase subunit SecD